MNGMPSNQGIMDMVQEEILILEGIDSMAKELVLGLRLVWALNLLEKALEAGEEALRVVLVWLFRKFLTIMMIKFQDCHI